jgi:acylphosphatase
MMRDRDVDESGGWNLSVRRFVVTGRVQGVGYRAFAARAARALRLTGGAANLDDGRVEIVAKGPQHALDRLEAALAEGSRVARVDRVEVEALAALPADASWDVDF